MNKSAMLPTRPWLRHPEKLTHAIGRVARQSHDLLFKAIHRNTLIYNACWGSTMCGWMVIFNPCSQAALPLESSR